MNKGFIFGKSDPMHDEGKEKGEPGKVAPKFGKKAPKFGALKGGKK